MKIYSTELIIREMQIKTTVRYQLIPLSIMTIYFKKQNKYWWDCEETGTLVHCWWEHDPVQLHGNQYDGSSKLKVKLQYDPVFLLGPCWKELKAESWREICNTTFIEAFFTIAKKWKSFRCSLLDEWISKMWYTHRMEYYLPVNKT